MFPVVVFIVKFATHSHCGKRKWEEHSKENKSLDYFLKCLLLLSPPKLSYTSDTNMNIFSNRFVNKVFYYFIKTSPKVPIVLFSCYLWYRFI